MGTELVSNPSSSESGASIKNTACAGDPQLSVCLEQVTAELLATRHPGHRGNQYRYVTASATAVA